MATQYKTFPYRGFGAGLNLRDSPDAVTEDQALDALNVLFSTRGSVEQRAGFAKFTSAEGTNRYDSLAAFYKYDGTTQLVAGAGNRLEALSVAGGVVASSSAPTASPHYFQRFGGPTAEHMYIANGVDAVRRWTGTIFETPTYSGITPSGRFLGLFSTDNRLVSARFSGATAGNNPSTVRFSAEGDPTTWATTWYVDLTPGDGEEITGVASWRDLVIVFKQTKFFVFYGNTTDDDGDPKFNYRPVDAGVGLVAPGSLAISEQGLYFLARTGIYFTAGAQPERVSDMVQPVFTGTPSVYYTGGTLNDGSIAQSRMAYHDNRLWFSFPAGTAAVNNRQLIFDPNEKWWSLYDMPAGPMATFRVGAIEELVFGYSSGTKDIGRHYEGSAYLADDLGTRYRNRVTNPSAEIDLSGWSAAGGAGIASSAVRAFDGSKSIAVTTPVSAVTGPFFQVTDRPDVGSNILWQIMVYSTTGGNFQARVTDLGSDVATQNFVVPAGVWTQIWVTDVVSTNANRYCYALALDAGVQTFWVDAAMFIQGRTTPMTYFDGDLSNSFWVGAANASQSIQFIPSVGGTAINALWQGGWFNYASPLVKSIRESILSGTGLVTVGFSRDYRQSVSQSAQLTLSPPMGLYDTGLLYDSGQVYGPSQSVRPKMFRKAIRGESFSLSLSNSTLNRTFKVHRLTTHVREARIPSVVKVN